MVEVGWRSGWRSGGGVVEEWLEEWWRSGGGVEEWLEEGGGGVGYGDAWGVCVGGGGDCEVPGGLNELNELNTGLAVFLPSCPPPS